MSTIRSNNRPTSQRGGSSGSSRGTIPIRDPSLTALQSSLANNAVDFGTVKPLEEEESYYEMPFTFKNNNELPLRFQFSRKLEGSDDTRKDAFSFHPEKGQVAAGEELPISVHFAPTQTRAFPFEEQYTFGYFPVRGHGLKEIQLRGYCSNWPLSVGMNETTLPPQVSGLKLTRKLLPLPTDDFGCEERLSFTYDSSTFVSWINSLGETADDVTEDETSALWRRGWQLIRIEETKNLEANKKGGKGSLFELALKGISDDVECDPSSGKGQIPGILKIRPKLFATYAAGETAESPQEIKKQLQTSLTLQMGQEKRAIQISIKLL